MVADHLKPQFNRRLLRRHPGPSPFATVAVGLTELTIEAREGGSVSGEKRSRVMYRGMPGNFSKKHTDGLPPRMGTVYLCREICPTNIPRDPTPRSIGCIPMKPEATPGKSAIVYVCVCVHVCACVAKPAGIRDIFVRARRARVCVRMPAYGMRLCA